MAPDSAVPQRAGWQQQQYLEMTTWLAPNSNCLFWYYHQPFSLYLSLSSPSTSSWTIDHWEKKRVGLLVFFFPLRVGDNLSVSLAWACIFIFDEPTTTPRVVSFFSVLRHHFFLWLQPASFPWKILLFSSQSCWFFYPATKWKGICSTLQPGPLGHGWVRGGLWRGSNWMVCSEMQWLLQGQGEEQRHTQEHWENPVLSWEKKLTAECFSKFWSLTGEIWR